MISIIRGIFPSNHPLSWRIVPPPNLTKQTNHSMASFPRKTMIISPPFCQIKNIESQRSNHYKNTTSIYLYTIKTCLPKKQVCCFSLGKNLKKWYPPKWWVFHGDLYTMGKKESKKSQNPPVQVVRRHLWHGRLPTTVASSQQSFPMSFGTQPHNGSTTVDASEIRLTHQLRLVVYPIIYRVFIHPGWLFGISSINSSSTTCPSTTKSKWFCHCHVFLPPEGLFTHMSHVYI